MKSLFEATKKYWSQLLSFVVGVAVTGLALSFVFGPHAVHFSRSARLYELTSNDCYICADGAQIHLDDFAEKRVGVVCEESVRGLKVILFPSFGNKAMLTMPLGGVVESDGFRFSFIGYETRPVNRDVAILVEPL